MCCMVSLGMRNGAGGCSRNVSLMTILRYLSCGVSLTSTLGLPLTELLISDWTFLITLGLLIISDIAHNNVTELVDVLPINASCKKKKKSTSTDTHIYGL